MQNLEDIVRGGHRLAVSMKWRFVLDFRPQEEKIQIEQEGEDQPECKLCFGTDNLIDGQVCHCTGSMANMCYNCMRGIIEHLDQYQRADDGWPLCRDCGGRFRSVDMGMTFGEYFLLETGTSLAGALCMVIIPIVILAMLIWAAINVGLSGRVNFLGALSLTLAICFVGLFLISTVYFLGYHYHQFRNSHHTEVYGVPYEEEPKIQDTYL